jgi:carboxylesterase type B
VAREILGDLSANVIEAFREAYPKRPLPDALYVDSFLRAPALKTASLKADQHTAPAKWRAS